jgi:hypothetical protein
MRAHLLNVGLGCCVMVYQAAFAGNKGAIVGSQTGAVLCGHKQMALVCSQHYEGILFVS